MEKKIAYIAVVSLVTVYVAYHLSFVKNVVWSSTSVVSA